MQPESSGQNKSKQRGSSSSDELIDTSDELMNISDQIDYSLRIIADQQQVREDRDRGGCDQEDHHLDYNRRERQDRQDRYYEERPRSGGSRQPEEHRRGGEERERQPNARD